VLGSPGEPPAPKPLALGGGGVEAASPFGAVSDDGESSFGSPTPRGDSGVLSPRSSGPGSAGGSPSEAEAPPAGWLPGFLPQRTHSSRYDLLRASESAASGGSPGGADAAGAGRDGGALRPAPAFIRALGAGAVDAWRRRRRPRALSYRYVVASLTCIVIAYGSRELDVKWDLWCYPRGWFQLHAVWHVMAANVRHHVCCCGCCACVGVCVLTWRNGAPRQSLWFLWVFMRSEAPAGSVTRPPAWQRLLPRALLRGGSLPSSGGGRTPRESDAAGGGATLPPLTPRAAKAIAAPAGIEMGSLSARGASATFAEGAPDGAGAVGVPAASARAAAHLRTRSREVFNLSGTDMV
jgi:hypothetical protein